MWNNCCCNHPCPIFCRRLRACTNDVVNPNLNGNFAFFNNTAVQTVGAFATIPVFFVLGEGTSVTSSSVENGTVNLAQGTYEISYFANVVIPASGTANIALALNNAIVSGSSVEVTGEMGEVRPVSQTIMLTVSQASTLKLLNNSNGSVTINLANQSIKKM